MPQTIDIQHIVNHCGHYYVYGKTEDGVKTIVVLYEKDPDKKTAFSRANYDAQDRDGNMFAAINFQPTPETCLFAHSATELDDPAMIAHFDKILTTTIVRRPGTVYLAHPETSARLFMDDGAKPDIEPCRLDPSVKADLLNQKILEYVKEIFMDTPRLFQKDHASLLDVGNYVFGKLRNNLATTRMLETLHLGKIDVMEYLEEVLDDLVNSGELLLHSEGNYTACYAKGIYCE